MYIANDCLKRRLYLLSDILIGGGIVGGVFLKHLLLPYTDHADLALVAGGLAGGAGMNVWFMAFAIEA